MKIENSRSSKEFYDSHLIIQIGILQSTLDKILENITEASNREQKNKIVEILDMIEEEIYTIKRYYSNNIAA